MPTVPSSPRVKLRAATRRVPRARADDLDESEPEPNMKLSRAIVVMLLLHVVAIGGILAFSLIKEHGFLRHGEEASAPAEAEDLHVPSTLARRPTEGSRPGVHVVRQGETLTRIANANGVTLEALVAANGKDVVGSGNLHAGQQLKLPEKIAAPARPTGEMLDAMQLIEGKADDAAPPATITKAAPRLPPDSGKTYVIGKGESAYTIAQKLKVTPDALLKLNGITDPKKLKPGQKLRVPAKAKA